MAEEKYSIELKDNLKELEKIFANQKQKIRKFVEIEDLGIYFPHLIFIMFPV